ncbi:hypothetical protein GXB81_10900 [Paraburkholderia sp. Ac-20336]|uniref:hypothetical protein n=1 Tax=Paraburkholderia sp. Ac-20336 TaxID=2703886 RepID=UPI001980B091|nr:hypothetical protein [Paraburkholderia sp. Ac-20336]MBN3803557.1 hypothetical protein [Paraburkholderia sp. Ac-20336]
MQDKTVRPRRPSAVIANPGNATHAPASTRETPLKTALLTSPTAPEYFLCNVSLQRAARADPLLYDVRAAIGHPVGKARLDVITQRAIAVGDPLRPRSGGKLA